MTDTPEKEALPPVLPSGDAGLPPPSAAGPDDAAAGTPALAASPEAPPADAPSVPSVPADALPPAPPTPPPPGGSAGDMKEAPLLEHLLELRTRLVRCLIAVAVGFGACYAFAERLLGVLLKPLIDVMPSGSKLIATGLPETFFTVMKLALVAGAFVVSPYIFYQLWRFVAPGLYKEERKLIVPIAIATAVFFVGGALFGYFVVFPFGFKFFVDYASDYITVMPTISAYFSLAVTLLFAFGLIFELPVFIFFLTSLGLVTTKALRKFRRWAILLSFIVSAMLTPTPDAINQLLMAGPMCALYELGIWVSWFVDKSRKEEKAAKERAEAEAAATAAAGPAPGQETPGAEAGPTDTESRAG
ncbi:Sec-independent protein translocase, TatC subunit [Solidesulfovibrio carbinoliphilus subsp. oakridgensis]|uniref:Sec-independent protein translocase protein TatC n=2 Tax=Solidesulfovibrio carbinoliphilus TaxID=345370 RepID=G7Q4P0_9BACT|nr:twin-arginine translocase subunit TatC [Solidesulfovibrio carbinoliphilus]EHJ47500.1 Sec-independent protein translocase, TatC subunit [Solidesulfovibrio carbinoliphilus subsp. oakridgensis]